MRITIITPTPTPVLNISPTISQPERINRMEISDILTMALFFIFIWLEMKIAILYVNSIVVYPLIQPTVNKVIVSNFETGHKTLKAIILMHL